MADLNAERDHMLAAINEAEELLEEAGRPEGERLSTGIAAIVEERDQHKQQIADRDENIGALEEALNINARLVVTFMDRAERAEAECDKLRHALGEAAMEINCSGPVAERIRVLKREHQEHMEVLGLERDHYRQQCEQLLKERDDLLETARQSQESHAAWVAEATVIEQERNALREFVDFLRAEIANGKTYINQAGTKQVEGYLVAAAQERVQEKLTALEGKK